MRRAKETMLRAARTFWRALRAWCGDSAYEAYLKSRAVRRAPRSAVSREEFYIEQLNRRYSRPNRCC